MRISFDYSKLAGRIKEKYDTQAAFAKELGLSPAALSQKLNNKADFSQEEIVLAAELLELPDLKSYFFCVKS